MLRCLPLQQLDKTLSPWRSLPRSRPSGGWLRAVRQALGMTTSQAKARHPLRSIHFHSVEYAWMKVHASPGALANFLTG
jgi:hypothetical protein